MCVRFRDLFFSGQSLWAVGLFFIAVFLLFFAVFSSCLMSFNEKTPMSEENKTCDLVRGAFETGT